MSRAFIVRSARYIENRIGKQYRIYGIRFPEFPAKPAPVRLDEILTYFVFLFFSFVFVVLDD